MAELIWTEPALEGQQREVQANQRSGAPAPPGKPGPDGGAVRYAEVSNRIGWAGGLLRFWQRGAGENH